MGASPKAVPFVDTNIRIIEQAQNNAEDSISAFLTSTGYERVVFC